MGSFQMTSAQASLFFATVAVLALRAPVELCILAFCCTLWHARTSLDGFKKEERVTRVDGEEASTIGDGRVSTLRDSGGIQDCSPFFTKFPAELRNQVYRHLLISKYDGNIERPDIILKSKSKELIYVKYRRDTDRIPIDLGIHTTILHTCSQAYMEALPILYGENIFEFSEGKELEIFKQEGLPTSSKTESRMQGSELPLFKLNPCPQGRLSLIRKLKLDITTNPLDDSSAVRKTHQHPSPPWRITDKRVRIASAWELLTTGRMEPIMFPSLEQLSLDFADLELETYEYVAVRPFAAMLRGKSGLKSLTVNGICNADNLKQFRKSLVRPEGEFVCSILLDRGERDSKRESKSESDSESGSDDENESDSDDDSDERSEIYEP